MAISNPEPYVSAGHSLIREQLTQKRKLLGDRRCDVEAARKSVEEATGACERIAVQIADLERDEAALIAARS